MKTMSLIRLSEGVVSLIFGEIVAGPEIDKETIVYGDIDLKLNAMAKSIINLTGSYSRWDIMSLNVRREQYRPLVPMEIPEPDVPNNGAAEVQALKERIGFLEKRLNDMESALESRKGLGIGFGP